MPHSGAAAFANPRGSWRDDFLRVALTIRGFRGIEPGALPGEGLARIASDLSQRDEREVEAEVRKPGFVSGWPVDSGEPTLVGADRVRKLTVASHAFACDYC